MSDEARGGAAAHAVTRVADLLVRSRLLPVNELQTLRVPDEAEGATESVVAALCQLLPERIVRHAATQEADDDAYVALVHLYAAATAEAWHPEGLRSTLDPLHDEAKVEFDQGDDHVRWRFQQPAERVAPDFVRLVNSFTAATLGGAFVSLPAEDGRALAIYLPEPAATELGELLSDLSGDEAASQITVPLTRPIAEK
jgi:hypothetical protein